MRTDLDPRIPGFLGIVIILSYSTYLVSDNQLLHSGPAFIVARIIWNLIFLIITLLAIWGIEKLVTKRSIPGGGREKLAILKFLIVLIYVNAIIFNCISFVSQNYLLNLVIVQFLFMVSLFIAYIRRFKWFLGFTIPILANFLAVILYYGG